MDEIDELVTFLRARLDEDEAWGRSPECGEYQDPARVLREVAAKRVILDSHVATPAMWRLLAAVYSDHADYRPEWKP